MGFLDAYFDPQNFQGQGGGLLAMLTKMAQAQPGQSQGFPQGDQGGGAMMPVPNMNAMAGARGDAGPAPYFPPQGPPAPPQAPPQPSVFQQIMAGIGNGINNNGNALLAGGGAMISGGLGHGLSAMAAAAPLDIMARRERQGNEAQAATYRALIKAGHSEADAVAGAQNPEILKTLVAKPTWGAIGTDALGNPKYGFINPIQQSITIPGGGAAAGGLSGIPEGLQGPALMEWFKKNDPVTAAGIQGIIDGDINAGSRNLQKLLPVAKLVDPTLNQADFQSRAKTRIDATTGRTAREIRALNTSTSHANDLFELIDKLGMSGTLPALINPASTAIRGQFSPEFQKLKGLYDSKAEALAGELPKAFNGGQTAEGDRAKYRVMLDINKSPAEKKAAVQSLMELMQGRLGAIADTYNQGMGTAREGVHFLSPENQTIFNRLKNGGATPSSTETAPPAPTEGVTATGPGGIKVKLQGNKWVPVQ